MTDSDVAALVAMGILASLAGLVLWQLLQGWREGRRYDHELTMLREKRRTHDGQN